MSDWDAFGADDLDLLIKVISLYPDLEMIAYAGKIARETLRYPVKDYDDLLPLFGGCRDTIREFRGHTVSFEQVVKYLPKSFFPIEDERQFLTRALVAFYIQDMASAGTEIAGFAGAEPESAIESPTNVLLKVAGFATA